MTAEREMPASPAEPPPFKVGDRVRRSGIDGGEGVVESLDQLATLRLWVSFEDGSEALWSAADCTLVAPATVADGYVVIPEPCNVSDTARQILEITGQPNIVCNIERWYKIAPLAERLARHVVEWKASELAALRAEVERLTARLTEAERERDTLKHRLTCDSCCGEKTPDCICLNSDTELHGTVVGQRMGLRRLYRKTTDELAAARRELGVVRGVLERADAKKNQYGYWYMTPIRDNEIGHWKARRDAALAPEAAEGEVQREHERSSELAQLREQLAEATTWRPIETAPKDGTVFWASMKLGPNLNPYQDTCEWFASERHEGGGWWVSHTMPCYPTHWFPLPPAPAEPTREKEPTAPVSR
jgi:hypothetical protein